MNVDKGVRRAGLLFESRGELLIDAYHLDHAILTGKAEGGPFTYSKPRIRSGSRSRLGLFRTFGRTRVRRRGSAVADAHLRLLR
jgi:hypothetical protein